MSMAAVKASKPQPEASEVERLESFDAESVGRSICAFLNAGGGQIVVGVDDDGAPIGLKEAGKIHDAVESELLPQLVPAAMVSATIEKRDNKNVVVIDVSAGNEPPYSFARIIYVRKDGRVEAAKPKAVAELIHAPKDLDRWERRLALGADLEDLSTSELDKLRERSKRLPETASGDGDSFMLLEQLNVAEYGSLRNSAVVLFANRPHRWFPQTRVRLLRYDSVDSTAATDSRTAEGNIFTLLDDIEAFFKRHIPINEQYTEGSFVREDVPALPFMALREAALNALMHRDYEEYDGSIKIKITPLTLDIWNPCKLPDGVTIDELSKARISRPRNPDIAHVLFVRGLIERVGNGMHRIRKACRDVGLLRPIWRQKAGGVSVTFRYSAPLNEKSQEKARHSEAKLNPFQRTLLLTKRSGDTIKLNWYRTQIAGDKISELQARNELNFLVELGFLSVRDGAKHEYSRTFQLYIKDEN